MTKQQTENKQYFEKMINAINKEIGEYNKELLKQSKYLATAFENGNNKEFANSLDIIISLNKEIENLKKQLRYNTEMLSALLHIVDDLMD